jgi:catechol 2,3-dioxygenase-like lactoylglutathione lyase family enzyme
MRLDHINIRAPRQLIDEVRAFYHDLLGMAAGPRPDFGSEGYWLYANDRALIHLSVSPEGSEPGPPGHLDHVAFRASDLPALRARLESMGVPFRTNHIPELDLTQVFFTDPAGIGIEINFPGEQ